MPFVRSACAVLAVLSVVAGLSVARSAVAAPAVVASIAPVQSLAAALMDGVGEVRQLVPTGTSPHTYAMKPSDTVALAEADVIFWVGPGLESFLPRVLGSVPRHAIIVELAEVPGVEHLPLRQGGPWGEHHHDDEAQGKADESHDHHDHDAAEGHDEEHGEDQHLWMNPANARAWVAAMADALAKADPEHAAAYQQRAQRLDQSLQALDEELRETLIPVQRLPFLVFHDAYQHMEKRYGLTAVGALTIDPGQPMGARRLAELRTHIKETGVRCIFAEPQFSDRLPKVVAENSPATIAVLDPLGQAFPAGPQQYPQTLREAARSLRDCLLAPH